MLEAEVARLASAGRAFSPRLGRRAVKSVGLGAGALDDPTGRSTDGGAGRRAGASRLRAVLERDYNGASLEARRSGTGRHFWPSADMSSGIWPALLGSAMQRRVQKHAGERAPEFCTRIH